MKIGGDSISAVTLGNASVSKLMLGNEQVWPELNLPGLFTEADLSGMSIGDTMDVVVNLPQMESGKQWLSTSAVTRGLGFVGKTEELTSAYTNSDCIFTLEKTASGFTLTPSNTTDYSALHWNINQVITGRTDDVDISAMASDIDPTDGFTFLFHNGEIKCLTGFWADYIGGLWQNVYMKPQVFRYNGNPTKLVLHWHSSLQPQDVILYKVPTV